MKTDSAQYSPMRAQRSGLPNLFFDDSAMPTGRIAKRLALRLRAQPGALRTELGVEAAVERAR